MAKKQGLNSLRPKMISVAVASCFVTSTAFANPTGPTVVHGTAAFQQAGNLLKITNSPSAIINWQSFSIGANEITRFIQQSQASAVMNRVTGAAGVIDPSVILGALQSNGRVLLINPSGIMFGAGAQVDVAGLVASSLNLSNADFLANRLKFTDMPGAGSVVNQGNITTGSGGSVYLVGPAVTNSGIITSPQGEVVLAAGNSVELVSPGTPNLRVEINAPDNEAVNLGQVVADAGRVGIYAGLIRNSGTVSASSAVAEGGKILLKATKNVTLDAGSVTAANGASGGSVTVQSGDTTLVSGTVEAAGTSGQGGTIHLLGDKVGLFGGASVNASGETGGGTVLAGGDFQGKNPEIQNATATYFGRDAKISADAVASGDGGKVIVWSDDATRFYGTITARGGAQSGNGGFAEVSGKGWLDFQGAVKLGAANGKSGTLLLDPSDVIINDVGNGSGDDGSFDGEEFFLNNSGPSLISWATIKNQLDPLVNNSNAIITTSGPQCSPGLCGDITIQTNSPDLATDNKLTLLAHRNIVVGDGVNGSVTNSGLGNVEMYAGWNGVDPFAPAVSTGIGTINLNSPITLGTSSARGDVILNAGNGITQALAGPITAAGLLAHGGAGNVDMQAANMVNALAGGISSPSTASPISFIFRNNQTLNIDAVGTSSGIGVFISPVAFGIYDAAIDVGVLTGDLNVNINVETSLSGFVTCATGQCPSLTGSVNLSAAQDVNVLSGMRGSAITVTAGRDVNVTNLNLIDGGSITADGPAGPSLIGVNPVASVLLDAGRNVTVSNSPIFASALTVPGNPATASITLTAGPAGTVNVNTNSTLNASVSDVFLGDGSGQSLVTLNAGNGIAVSDSMIRAGHSGGSSFLSVTGGAATVSLNGGNGTVNVSNSALSAFAGVAGSGATGFNANVAINGNGITVDNSTIQARAYYGSSGGGAATVSLNGNGGAIQVQNASTLSATGGSGSSAGAGDALVSLTSNTISVTDSTITSTGGSGFGFSGAGGHGQVALNASTGITVSGSDINAAGGSGFSGTTGGNATVTLVSTGGNIVLDTSTSINVSGGQGGSGEGSGFNGGNATVALCAGDLDSSCSPSGGISVVGGSSITAQGGISGFGFAFGGNGTVSLTAGSGGITIGDGSGAGSVQAYAGIGGDIDLSGYAKAGLSATGNIVVSNASTIEALANGEGSAAARQANVELTSTAGNITIASNSNLFAWGLQGDSEIDQPPAVVLLQATGAGKTITVDASTITSDGTDAAAVLVADGGVIVSGGSVIDVIGSPWPDNDGSAVVMLCGGGFSGFPSGACSPSATSTVQINGSVVNATGNDINGSPALVQINAGSGGIAMTSGAINVTSTNGPAAADLSASGNITLNGSTISVQSNDNTTSAQGGSFGAFADSGPASVTVQSFAGSISMDSGGSINVATGSAGTANFFGSGSGTQASAIASSAQASLFAANGVTMDGTITATGGNGGSAFHAYGGSVFANGGDASVSLNGGNATAIVNGTVTATGGNGGSANSSNGNAFAGGGQASVGLFGLGGVFTDTGVISVNGGTGGTASGGLSDTADGGQANFDINTPGPITIGAGGIMAAGGTGGIGGPRSGGFAGIFVDGGEGVAGNVQILGALNATGGGGTNGGNGGTAYIAVAGTDVNLLASGSLNSTGGSGTPLGAADVEIISTGNVTLGGNINTSGENFSDDGIFIEAGGAIISTGIGGILRADKAGSIFPHVTLNAVSGIGTPLAPIRMQDGAEATSPELFLNNTTAGDIAVSFVSGNVEIVNDLAGLFNGNAAGIYSINVENGNFLLATGFLPDESSLLSGQNVSITTPNGDITFGNGASLVTTGGGTITASGTNINVLADSAQALVKSSGLMTVNATGTLTLQGGAGTNTSAQLVSDGGQNISAATINLTGGSSGAGNSARIANTAGVQTISGSPNITLTGGSGGLADQGNFAQIFSGGSQNITAGNMTIAAGTSGGFNNFANIVSPVQTISIGGDLTMTGGNSQASANSGGGARIGGIGGMTPSATNLMLDVTGSVSLTGGSLANAGASIGSNFKGGQATDITINAGGDVTLNPGSVSGARIGSPAASVAGGDIAVTALGNLALNSAAGIGTSIRTLGDVTLQANSMTQGPDSVIQANQLIAIAPTGMNLFSPNNSVTLFNGASSGGNVLFNNATALTVNGGSASGIIDIANSGSGNLTVAGGVSGASVDLSSVGDVLVTSVASVTSSTGTTLTGVNVTQDAGTGISGPLNATATGGNISLQQAGAYTLGTLSAASGAVSVTSSGADIVVDSGASITALTGTSLTGANVIQTAGNLSGLLNATATSGNVDLTQAGAYTLGAISGTGTVAVTSTAADITLGVGSSITSGTGATLTGLNVTQSGGTITGPISASATAGDVTLSQAGAFTLGAVDATGAVAVTSTGADVVVGPSAVISSGTGSSLTGLNVTQTGGTISGPISASATAGNVSLIQAGGYTLGAISGTGTVAVTSTAADVVVGAGASITSGAGTTLTGINVTQSGGTISGLISATATGGTISFNQAGGYTLGLLSANTAVNVTTSGAILDGIQANNILAPTATLSAGTGVGSIADPLQTLVGQLAVSSIGGEIGIINSGSLILNGLSGGASNAAIYASTQFGAPSASLSLGGPVSVSGNLSLLADTGMTVDKNVSAGGALVLDGGAGDLDILPGAGNTMVQAGGVVLLNGANVHLGHASQTTNLDVIGGSGLGIISAGELTVQGGSGGYTFVRSNSGNLAIATVGNVTVTGGDSGGFAHVLGSPDVTMSVGGTVQFNATDPTAPARIESAIPASVYVDFTTVPSGGYFVNGQESVTADPALGTGFYADGVPAVLDQNLFISYGGIPLVPPATSVPGVEQVLSQIIASTNQQTDATNETPGEVVTLSEPQEGEKDKKGLPVCK